MKHSSSDDVFTTPTSASSSPTESIKEIIHNILKEAEAETEEPQPILESVGDNSTQWGEEAESANDPSIPENGTYVPTPISPNEPTIVPNIEEIARPPPPDTLRVAPWRGSGLYRYKLYFEEATRALFTRIGFRRSGQQQPAARPRLPPPDLIFLHQQRRNHHQPATTGEQQQQSRLRRLASSLAEKVRRVRESGRFAW